MINKIIGAIILSLVLFVPYEAKSQNTYDIPDDIRKNIEKKTTPPAQPANKEAGAAKPGGGTQKKGGNSTPKKNGGNVQGKKNNEAEATTPTNTKKLKPGVHKFQGFRIQVFSDGSNQATLQTRAKARGNAIVAKFPKYRGQVYSFSKSPNWYTQVGNFLTQEEANKALAELKRAFPNFANEMRVVKSKVTIIKK